MTYDHNTTRVKKIELTPVYIPFKEEVRSLMQDGASGVGFALSVDQPWLGGEFVICRLYDQAGHIGTSEIFTWIPETGVSVEAVIDTVKNGLSPYVLNQNPYEIERIRTAMNNNVNQSEVAKGLLDMALHELIARIENKPVYQLLGGHDVGQIDLAHVLPLMDESIVKGLAEMMVASGIRTFRLKLGNGLKNDVALVKMMRDTFGDDIRLRVDYNQAYSPNVAVQAIKAIEPYQIDYAEQPTSATNFAGMAYIQQRVDVPLMAHEGCFGLKDIITLSEMGAVRVLGLNSERPGGITDALRAIDYASCKGLDIAFHNQPTGIGSAQILHTVAARYDAISHPTELQGHLMLEHDLLQNPINYDDGCATLPMGEGWGVELDVDALRHYAKGPTVVIE